MKDVLIVMKTNKFAGIWFCLGVVSLVVGGIGERSKLLIVGVLFLILAYVHEGVLTLFQIEKNTRRRD